MENDGRVEAKVIDVIRTITLRGDGSSEEPFRRVTQHWSFDGTLIGSDEPVTSEHFRKCSEAAANGERESILRYIQQEPNMHIDLVVADILAGKHRSNRP